MNTDDTVLNKTATIQRCIRRIKEEYGDNPKNLQDLTKQDSVILNLQRACEACIDMAMHVVAEKKLGIPQHSKDAFDLLQSNHYIDPELSRKLKAMVGFRNIAVHDYQAIQIPIIQGIIEQHLEDFSVFATQIKDCLKQT
ncbi:DUF86 domain-containing protein [Paenibacillaceae bacterium WGS1546]|uniref:type VII toxin-antitoxin system HepT family RNase toxin n=1 Tax=Cohnella sp. WGS1546 TaxID=3366810 RepID=UPI00372D70C5